MKRDNNAHSNSGSCGQFFREVVEHVTLHSIGHAVGGPIGSLTAGLLHTGTLNENEDELLAQHRVSPNNTQPKEQSSNNSTTPKP